MIRKREPRWQSAADRARVAAELIEEAASLTDESNADGSAEWSATMLPTSSLAMATVVGQCRKH